MDDDGQRKGNESNIGDNVGSAHGDDLGEAIAASCAGIWDDLPVVVERLTFREGGDYDGEEGDNEEEAEKAEGAIVGLSPDRSSETLKELEYGEFDSPYANGMVS